MPLTSCTNRLSTPKTRHSRCIPRCLISLAKMNVNLAHFARPIRLIFGNRRCNTHGRITKTRMPRMPEIVYRQRRRCHGRGADVPTLHSGCGSTRRRRIGRSVPTCFWTQGLSDRQGGPSPRWSVTCGSMILVLHPFSWMILTANCACGGLL